MDIDQTKIVHHQSEWNLMKLDDFFVKHGSLFCHGDEEKKVL